MSPNRAQTTCEEWVEAGYDAVCEGGLEAVNVEVIASRLGVSKAGFYHRFRDRQALIDAILTRWTARAEAEFERHSDMEDPDEQLRSLLKAYVLDERLRRADARLLLHEPDDPAYAEYGRQNREISIEFGTVRMRHLGMDAGLAAVRARLLWVGYLGIIADMEARGEPRSREEAARFVDQLMDMVLAPAPKTGPSVPRPAGRGHTLADARSIHDDRPDVGRRGVCRGRLWRPGRGTRGGARRPDNNRNHRRRCCEHRRTSQVPPTTTSGYMRAVTQSRYGDSSVLTVAETARSGIVSVRSWSRSVLLQSIEAPSI